MIVIREPFEVKVEELEHIFINSFSESDNFKNLCGNEVKDYEKEAKLFFHSHHQFMKLHHQPYICAYIDGKLVSYVSYCHSRHLKTRILAWIRYRFCNLFKKKPSHVSYQKFEVQLNAYLNSLEFGKHYLSVFALAVLPNYQKRGLGKELLQFLMNQAQLNEKDVPVVVNFYTEKLIGFYEACGFRHFRTKKMMGRNIFTYMCQ